LRSRPATIENPEQVASDAGLPQPAFAAIARCERETEKRLVDELIAETATKWVALGIPVTLDVLSDGRVHVLFIVEGLGLVRDECSACRKLDAAPGPCPTCGLAATVLTDLDERVIQRTLARGARESKW
jgi:hypothetical protein